MCQYSTCKTLSSLSDLHGHINQLHLAHSLDYLQGQVVGAEAGQVLTTAESKTVHPRKTNSWVFPVGTVGKRSSDTRCSGRVGPNLTMVWSYRIKTLYIGEQRKSQGHI